MYSKIMRYIQVLNERWVVSLVFEWRIFVIKKIFSQFVQKLYAIRIGIVSRLVVYKDVWILKCYNK